MKRKSLLICLLAMCCTLFSFFATACTKTKEGPAMESIVASVEFTDENTVAIRVSDVYDNTFLLTVMQTLQMHEKLTFTKDSTNMVTGINGKQNPADWSACWMLYTSDTDFASEQFGSCIYDGVEYDSAIFGAAQMPVVNGGLYIWKYTSF